MKKQTDNRVLSLKHSGILKKKIFVTDRNSAFCLHYAYKRSHPFVEDSGFVSHAEKHRFGHEVVVSKVCYGILEYIGMCFPICHFDFCNELLATVGWKRSCQPLSCPCSQNVTHCQTEIFSTWLSNPFQGIPSIEVPESTSSALWLHHAHPFVAAAEKNLSHAERQRVWSRSCDLKEVLQVSNC